MNKGFTLVELLGVIVILGLIMVLVLPKVTGYVRSSTTKTDKLTEDLIYDASNLYLENNKNIYDTVNGSVYCISLKTLVKENYLKGPITFADGQDITGTKSIQATFNNKYSLKLVDSNECKEVVSLAPELFDGLVPVVYNNSNWQIADPSSNWYNYSNQQWANAVILKDDVNKNIGDIVTVDGNNPDVIAMFVWIPRYSYTIKGTYGKGGVDLANPGEIDIKFVSRGTKEKGSANYIGENPNNWLTHPAFTFGGKELRGIWVGKFETSAEKDSLCYTNPSNDNCNNDLQNPYILPNRNSLRYQTVSNEFKVSQKFNTNLNGLGDSHMMKNSEWGAVAYLSQSKYGKYGNNLYIGANKEIYQNKSSDYITGSSNGTPSQDGTLTQCPYNDITDKKDGTGSCGGGASTTGNITGIYDMSGGAWDRVMANNNNKVGHGIDATWFKEHEKYYDLYVDTNLNNSLYMGHAVGETSGWYSDLARLIEINSWLFRGGCNVSTTYAGVFSLDVSTGGPSDGWSFRVVLSPTR